MGTIIRYTYYRGRIRVHKLDIVDESDRAIWYKSHRGYYKKVILKRELDTLQNSSSFLMLSLNMTLKDYKKLVMEAKEGSIAKLKLQIADLEKDILNLWEEEEL